VGRSFTTNEWGSRTFSASIATSIYAWVKGALGTGRIVDHQAGIISLFDGTTGSAPFRFSRLFTTGFRQWSLAYADQGSPVQSAWHHWAWTHDATLDVNTPVPYVDGELKSGVTISSAVGTGTAQTGSGTLYAGNRAAGNRPLGTMGYLAIHNVVLTQGEIRDAMRRGFTPRGLVAFWPLFGDPTTEPDYSGLRASLALTGSSVVAGPPVSPFLIVPAQMRAFVPPLPFQGWGVAA
jgi:hypothetical protein